MIDERGEEQRVAVASLAEQRRDLSPEVAAREARRQILRAGFLAATTERDLDISRVRAQRLHEPTQRMASARQLTRAIAADHQQPRRLAPRNQEREQIHRRWIAPV